MATIVYIDGFNLYYGAVKGTPNKWLDLEAMCRRLLPKDSIVKVRYFTALIAARPNDPQQPARQQAYLRALGTLPLLEVDYGHYLSHPVRMWLANPPAPLAGHAVDVLQAAPARRSGELPAPAHAARRSGRDPQAGRLVAKTQRPAEAGLAPSHRSNLGDEEQYRRSRAEWQPPGLEPGQS